MMLRHAGVGLSSEGPAPLLLRPLGQARNRASEVVEQLTAEIASGRLVLGAQLPTEQEMMAAFGVSRSVVREAVAALRADGLVTTRQGLGCFVASDPARRPFRIDPDGLGSLRDVVDLMELRLAVEVEAAGLAAERGDARALRAVRQALAAFEAAAGRGDSSVGEDFAFHSAIAAATGNSQFARFLEYLGRFIIPRQSIRVQPPHHGEPGQGEPGAYLRMLEAEHRAIAAAILAHDAAGARLAMRDHLLRSRERYRGMMTPGR